MKFVARLGEQVIPVEIERSGGDYDITIGERKQRVEFVEVNEFVRSLRLENGDQFIMNCHKEDNRYEISFSDRKVHLQMFDPLSMKRRRIEDEFESDAASVKAIMPGRVVRILVKPGDAVKKGTGLLILEAMKMQNEIAAPRDGVVARIAVEPAAAVESGDDLVILE